MIARVVRAAYWAVMWTGVAITPVLVGAAFYFASVAQ